jgi:hypothetical protein
MATSVKQLIEAASAVVPKITPAQAREMIAKRDWPMTNAPSEHDHSGHAAQAGLRSRSGKLGSTSSSGTSGSGNGY